MTTLLHHVLIIAPIICLANSARILGIFNQNSYSHFILADRMYRELAMRGHEVTLITPFEQNNPMKNFKYVELTGLNEILDSWKLDMFKVVDINVVTELVEFYYSCLTFTEIVLNHTNVQQLLNSNQKFDLVIHEKFVNDAFHGFAYHYKVPSVVISSVGISAETAPQMGNPYNPSYIPDIKLPFSSDMNFVERVVNTIAYLSHALLLQFFEYQQNILLQKYFPGSPHVNELMRNTSLMLLNSHVSIGPAIPLLPNVVEIGGYHLQPPNPLSQDLQKYLDDAKNGAIFVSMGSNLKSKYMPEQMRDGILRVFSKLKQNVLWKWEDDVLPGKPTNVRMEKWLPQQDILAHPNVKLFVTHGGLLSITETVYHGVPILGIPIYGDQHFNMKNAEYAGFGLTMFYDQFNEQSFEVALNDLLTNPRYLKNARLRSKVMRDQPMQPLERAMYWIEYVIRHQGAPHLKTAALDLTWYQYLLVDVMAFMLLITLAISIAIYKIAKVLCCYKHKGFVEKDKKSK